MWTCSNFGIKPQQHNLPHTIKKPRHNTKSTKVPGNEVETDSSGIDSTCKDGKKKSCMNFPTPWPSAEAE